MNHIHHINVDSHPISHEYEEVARQVAAKFPHPGDMVAWADAHTVTEDFQGRPIRYLKYVPGEPSGKTLVAGGEFANGNEQVTNVARLALLGQSFDPNATLVFLPGSNLNHNVLSLTRPERGKVVKGDISPVVDRYRQILDGEDDLTLFGPSQGAFTLGTYAAHPDTPVSALTVFEAPDTQDRSLLSLGLEYGNSGSQLAANVQRGFEPIPTAAMTDDALRSITPQSLVRYALGIPRLDNLALATMMTRNHLGYTIDKALEKGGSVVQAWGTKANLSGDAANTTIAEQHLDEPRFEAYRLTGERSDHSVTNLTHIADILVKRSRELRNAQTNSKHSASRN